MEIYVEDSKSGLELYDLLFEQGKEFNVKPGCPHLIERIEGALLSYGNDMDINDNPLECGLEKFVNLDTNIEFLGKDNLIKIKSEKRPVMICSWHGRLLFPVFNLNKLNFYALAGLHKDAEIISRICEKLGWKMIRGSSSKGGYKAYKGILNKLSSNNKIYITPDGPKGPIHIIKNGIVEASIKKEALILPISGISSCLLYTSPSPRDRTRSRMPSSA